MARSPSMTLIGTHPQIGDQVAIRQHEYFLAVQIVAIRQKRPTDPMLYIVQDFRHLSHTCRIEDFWRLSAVKRRVHFIPLTAPSTTPLTSAPSSAFDTMSSDAAHLWQHRLKILEEAGELSAIPITLDRSHNNTLLALTPAGWTRLTAWAALTSDSSTATVSVTRFTTALRQAFQDRYQLPQRPRLLPPDCSSEQVLTAMAVSRQQEQQDTRNVRRQQRQEDAQAAPRFPVHSLQHGQFMTRTPEHADDESYNMPWDQ